MFNLFKKLFGETISSYFSFYYLAILKVLIYFLSSLFPDFLAQLIQNKIKRIFQNTLDVDIHFKPKYKLGQQRACVIKDGDLFEKVKLFSQTNFSLIHFF